MVGDTMCLYDGTQWCSVCGEEEGSKNRSLRIWWYDDSFTQNKLWNALEVVRAVLDIVFMYSYIKAAEAENTASD